MQIRREEDRFIVNVLARLTHPDEGAAAERMIAEQSGALDWEYLVRRMFAEGVSFLFFYYVKQCHLLALLPQEVGDTLSAQYHANLRRNLIAGTVLKPIFEAFNDERIPFLVLKGLALAELVYPGLGVRGVSDADILVHRSDLRRVATCLHGRGYTPRDSSVEQACENPVGYLASLDFRKEEGSLPNLHVHWHTVNTSVPATMFAGCIDLDRFWEGALPIPVADAAVRVLCAEHQLLYLCEHALRINHSFDRLILMYDIFFVVKVYENAIDWNYIVNEARRSNIAKLVFLSLSIVRHYTMLPLAETVMERLSPAKLTLGEKLFLNLQLSGSRFRGASVLVYLAMNEGFFAKCCFLFRTFFPPRQILMQRRYAKDIPFTAFLYAQRVWEVVSQLLRIRRRNR